MLRKLTEKDIDITVDAQYEDLQIRGNAIASGDDEYDKTVEDELIRRVETGDVWAWASVSVTAKFGRFEAVNYLGGCSYKDEADFINNSGYYEDMKDEAIEDLNAQLQKTYNELKKMDV